MNILLINWQDIKNPLGGGAEVHMHEIFKRIVARGHKVTLFCSMFLNSKSEEDIDGIRVIREGTRNRFNYFVYPRYRKKFRFEKYDIVVDDINKIPFYTPLFVKEPLIGIIHHLFGKSIFLETSLPAAMYVYLCERMAMKVYRNTKIAVVSPSTQQEMMHFGYDESQLPIVPNCVDHSLYVPPLNKKTTGYTIGYLGRLKKYKSADHLLRAFHILKKEMPELKLVIVGDGDARGGLEILANELGIADSVTFAGYVTEKVKVELLHTMDFIVNSSAKEGWGLTVIEANACGVPVIASNVQGLKDSVIHEKTGLLYPYGDISKLVNSMRTLLLNKKVRDNCAAEALKWAQTFDWEQSASKMLAAMESVIRNKH